MSFMSSMIIRFWVNLIDFRFGAKQLKHICRQNSHQLSYSAVMSSQYKPLVICGPSGSGKSTLLNKLMDQFNDCFKFSISHTTRSPRNGETNGKEYHFVDKQTFELMIEQKLFIEFTNFSDNYYGTTIAALEEVQRSGRIPVLDVELEGVRSLKNVQKFDAKYVFIKPPNFETLERNLRSRGSEDENSLQRRLTQAVQDIKAVEANSTLFDLILINDNLEEAFSRLKVFVQMDINAIKCLKKSD